MRGATGWSCIPSTRAPASPAQTRSKQTRVCAVVGLHLVVRLHLDLDPGIHRLLGHVSGLQLSTLARQQSHEMSAALAPPSPLSASIDRCLGPADLRAPRKHAEDLSRVRPVTRPFRVPRSKKLRDGASYNVSDCFGVWLRR